MNLRPPVQRRLAFADVEDRPRPCEALAEGALLLRGFALPYGEAVIAELPAIVAAAPFRHLVTPGGHRMSVAMTNCGALGWVSDRCGYRYERCDPDSARPWPAMPTCFRELAADAARAAGHGRYAPDVCLVNRYAPGSRLTLHQDRDERGLAAPIVSVSFGLPATFLLGGLRRSDRTRRVELTHGDVVVLGGPSRLRFHGVLPLKAGVHEILGGLRINLTFRKAG